MVLRVMCLDRCLVANLGNRDRDEALHGGIDVSFLRLHLITDLTGLQTISVLANGRDCGWVVMSILKLALAVING